MAKLYCLGIGPGDPELLTIRAWKILKEVASIFVPKGKEDGGSIALSIVQKMVDLNSKEIVEVYFPMRKTKNEKISRKWQEASEAILGRLNKGIDVAFLTLGDPMFYSTFFYLYRLLELNQGLNIEIIPGVSSINAASGKAKIPLALADEKIAILPANYMDDLKETLERFDTVVLMKVHRVFDDLLNTLGEMNLLDRAIYILKVGREGEKIFKNIKDVKQKDLDYFSMMIVRK